jgi:serine/threonine-protein kinase
VATSPHTASALAKNEPAELSPGTLVEGRYRVVRLIGVGGTGVVYEVEHLRTAQRLALKTLLDPQHAPRLEQEARALAKLRSPHVVKVVDLGISDAGPYFVMTLLEGKNLRDVLESKVKLGVSFVANLALQMAEGLDEAHRAGLVHRDLKPDNLHIAEPRFSSNGKPSDGKPPAGAAPHDLSHVTVFDFGVVKLATPEVNTQLTRTGSTVGTPYYMSLEQLRGSGTVDAVSDVYAMSVLLYECLAGARPFEAGTLGDLIFAICSTSPTPLSTLRPDLPKEIADVIMRGLSREKAERPQSIRDLAKVFAPHGDAAFTLWLRRPEPMPVTKTTAAPERAPAVPVVPRVGSVRPAPAGKDAPPLPRVPKLTTKLGAPDKPSFGVPPPVVAAPLVAPAPTDPDPTNPDHPPSRDTPTEMFVRDVHGNLVDPHALSGASLSGQAMPTMSLPTADGAPFVAHDGDLEPADKTAVIEVPPPTPSSSGGARAPTFGAPPVSQAGSISGPTSQGGPMGHGSPASQTGPAFAGAAVSSRGSLAAVGPVELGKPRSKLEESLDKALTDLGKGGNRLGLKALARFRSASQEQQIVVVVVVTALVAVLIVVLGYALIL